MAADTALSQKHHRERLRTRIKNDGLESLHEHEIVEFLLMALIPQKDVKPLAYELLNRFGNFSGILDAGYEELITVSGIGDYVATYLSAFPRLFGTYQLSRVRGVPIDAMRNIADAVKHCETLFYGRQNETMYIITLDTQKQVIRDTLLREGTVNEVSVYPREVVEIATRQKAAGVLLSHNHPSGDHTPSDTDIALSRDLVAALASIRIPLVDHIIISRKGYSSLRMLGYLGSDSTATASVASTSAVNPAQNPASHPASPADAQRKNLSIAAEKEQRPQSKKDRPD